MLAGRALRLMAPARRGAAAGQLLFGRAWQQGTPPAQPHGARPWLTRTEATDASAQPGDAADGSGGVPVFTAFQIYKGKGAMTVKPVRPRWTTTEGGAWKLDKEGCFMLEVAGSTGTRQYDWPNKISVALSPLELAAIVEDPDKADGHAFYHDTFKSQPGKEGTLVKTIKWSRAADGSAYYVNVYVADKTAGPEKKNNNATCSVSRAEFVIFKQLVLSSIPAMYGFDVAMGSIG